MSGRLIAVGDIHGCAAALATLLDALAPTNRDRLVVLGDYVDRGLDSRRVIDQLLALEQQCHLVALLGNHEVMLLRALESHRELHFWLEFGGRETLGSYGGRIQDIPPEHVAFIRRGVRSYESDHHIFVHANYDANLPLDQQPDSLLFWTHLSRLVPAPHISGKIAVVGHTPQVSGEVLNLGHVICLDTCCFGGGWLSALDVATSGLWQADETGRRRIVP
jgi:serine/threonine protein phosphatase 1